MKVEPCLHEDHLELSLEQVVEVGRLLCGCLCLQERAQPLERSHILISVQAACKGFDVGWRNGWREGDSLSRSAASEASKESVARARHRAHRTANVVHVD